MIDFLLDTAFNFCCKILDLLVRLLISTPRILISSFHGEGSYLERMRQKYAKVYESWRNQPEED